MTRTKETEESYFITAERLLNRFYNETGKNVFVEPFAFIDWLKDLFEQLSSSSIRQYKAALIFYLKKKKAPHDLMDKVYDLSGCNRKKLPKRTSSKKSKEIKINELKKVIQNLQRSRSEYARFSILFLITNIFFGFRPKEWASAKIDKENGSITINNGKNTNGRANGDQRTVKFPKDHDALICAEELIKEIKVLISEGKSWETIYSGARRLLYNKQVDFNFPRVTNYSTRHQFAANMKASGVQREIIAQIMGHKSIKTASLHYANRQTGKKIKKENIPNYVPSINILNKVIGKK